MALPCAWPLLLGAIVAAAPEEADFVVERTELDGLLAETSVARAPVEVGMPVVFTVRLGGPGRTTAALARAETLGAFDLLDIRQVERGGADAVFLELTLSTLDAGTVKPEPLALRWTVDGAEREGAIAFPSVDVRSLLPAEIDPQAFRDIAGEVVIPGPLDWWPWAVGALALAGAGAVAWWVLRARPRVPPTPEAWALAEFSRLEAEALPSRREYGRYYDDLTATVRGYVARRFAIPADRQTSREFLDAARAHGEFPDGEVDRLRALLRIADAVKFARAEPTRDECDGHLAEARGFVAATAPAREEAPR